MKLTTVICGLCAFFEICRDQPKPLFSHLKTLFLLQQSKLTTNSTLDLMAPHLESQRREVIKFAISSTQVTKPNLKAIIKVYYIIYNTVL
ncbi:hypothetical protein NA56DRAFT_15320 [Hyaloscypha hepaticicola]|uniref:Uncharacterized protein n=1 Tax=Hyaloscypha hepaticicola TaxID=2082293 RepID=A0A2J6QQD3_9HELO|nr:hypothetical protein NA56DRAFT_15320 [Hyaloscypha hepaticicola]